MTRILLLAPLALAACGAPCPVPVTCTEPFGCMCLLSTVDELPRDGGKGLTISASSVPDHNGGQTSDNDDSNGHGSSDGSNSSDENGGKS